MSTLTDIYAATASDASGYGIDPHRDKVRFPDCLQMKDITSIELSELWSVLRTGETQTELEAEFEILLGGASGVIYRIPERMLKDLIQLPPDKIPQAASAWAKIDEPWWTPADAQVTLESLVAIACRAAERKLGLYVWINV